ncbi:MAG: hypothetical protein C0603_07050 [Denitrovibrio sp.]|nr:MAG: hypothetical protein C0603_07050 [Denitrovibrio sp.]
MFKLFGNNSDDFKDIFEQFYNNIMSNDQLSIFFKNKHQVRHVIAKQLEHFSNIHSMNSVQLKSYYRKMGKEHALMGISFSTLETATEYLFRQFLLKFSSKPDKVVSLERFFSKMKSDFAYGYLEHEIEVFTERLRLLNRYSSNTHSLKNHIEWFLMLHTAILQDDNNTIEMLSEAKPTLGTHNESAKDLAKDLEKVSKNFDTLEKIMFFNLKQHDFKGTLATYISLKESFLTLTYLLSLMEQEAMSESFATDPLTEALTRRQMTSIMDKSATKAMIANSAFTVAMADIDHFKNVNDTYGHKAGDIVLKQFSAILMKHTATESAEVIRYGGEEFLIIFPNSTGEETFKAIDDMRDIIEMTPFNIGTGMIHITSSFGLNEVKPSKGEIPDPLAIIKEADENLYLAKKSGRNCVKI